jgi:hypothetical protein
MPTIFEAVTSKITSLARRPESVPARQGKSHGDFKILPPAADTNFTSAQLADLVTPESIQDSPFGRFHDLSLFARDPAVIPAGRREGPEYYYFHDELPWLSSLETRFNCGDIDAHTLVIANTGHGPAIALAMAQRFRSDIFMNYPSESIACPGSAGRILDQGQSFFQGIHTAIVSGQRQASSTLLTVEFHQDHPMLKELAAALPSAKGLRQLGINRIFYAVEDHRDPRGVQQFNFAAVERRQHDRKLYRSHRESAKNFQPLHEWLRDVQRQGFNVLTDGIDIRIWPVGLGWGLGML